MNLSRIETLNCVLQCLDRGTDYENAKLLADINKALARRTTDDALLDIAEEASRGFCEWADNYDPTPYEAPVK